MILSEDPGKVPSIMPTPVFIPTVGTNLILAEPWTFTLFSERRNKSLWEVLKPEAKYSSRITCQEPISCTLPENWELTVDRIYIRSSYRSFDSITFKCAYNGKRVRFWVKLADANNMVVKTKEEVKSEQ